MRLKCGGVWNDKSEKYASPVLVCERCLEKARERNMVEDIDPPVLLQLGAVLIGCVLLLIVTAALGVLFDIPLFNESIPRPKWKSISFAVSALISIPVCLYAGMRFVARFQRY